DFNSAFFKKGKKWPFTIHITGLRDVYRNFFEIGFFRSNFPDCETNNIFSTLEKFMCRMYGCKKICNVNEIQLAYIAIIWSHAHLQCPTLFPPLK
ncbi:hypothetical protein ALC56_09853, partial [Trachymyrmex septentrionalis]